MRKLHLALLIPAGLALVWALWRLMNATHEVCAQYPWAGRLDEGLIVLFSWLFSPVFAVVGLPALLFDGFLGPQPLMICCAAGFAMLAAYLLHRRALIGARAWRACKLAGWLTLFVVMNCAVTLGLCYSFSI